MTHDLPPATSASQLTTYAMCPRKYVLQYGYGIEPEFRSTPLILGSAFHSAVGWWFEEKLAGKAPAIETAREILAADLMAGAGGASVRWKDATPESLESDAVRYLNVYLARFGDLPVTAIETPFTVDLTDPETGEVLGRPMKGYLDLVLEKNRIVEVKTSSRGWTDFDLVRHLQVGAYAFVYNTLHGGPSEVEVHVIVKLKRDPRVEVYPIERGESATRWWLQAAAAIERAITAGSFPPKPSALCHECEYEHACAAWTDDEPIFDSALVRTVAAPREEARAVADL